MIKIKANEDLFTKWNLLSAKISAMKSIVQNDMEVSEEEIREWRQVMENLLIELNFLRNQVYDYVIFGN